MIHFDLSSVSSHVFAPQWFLYANAFTAPTRAVDPARVSDAVRPTPILRPYYRRLQHLLCISAHLHLPRNHGFPESPTSTQRYQ
jgi:hypothetical protein